MRSQRNSTSLDYFNLTASRVRTDRHRLTPRTKHHLATTTKTNMVRKSKKGQQTPPETPPAADKPPQTPVDRNAINSIEESIVNLRKEGKSNPDEVDYNKRLREILDQISDEKGEERRPVTAMPTQKVEDEEEDEEEEEDEDKTMINKRLTTCMLLALVMNSENEDESVDFFKKMKKRNDMEEVLQPFTKDEMKRINALLKEKSDEARKRVKKSK